MNKSSLLGFVWLFVIFLAATSGLQCPAFADNTPNLKQKSSSGNDADRANMFSVRQDYFKRYPFAKMAEKMRGRVPDDTKEQKGARYEMSANDLVLEIPPGPLVAKQTDKPHSPDPYTALRPQYRPLYSLCGGAPGAFLPQPQPGMLGTFVPNYSTIARGEGGNVITLIPTTPTCYVQPLLTYDNGREPNMSQEGDQAMFQYELTTFGVGPISDTQLQMIDRQDNQRFLELLFDPERWLWAGRAAGIMQQQQMSTNLANTADWESNTAMDTMNEFLLNVANEEAGQPVQGNPPHKSKAQAIYMVQKMYKRVFVPMAILFLLPGAILTQMKGMVQFGVMKSNGADAQSPFTGIIRSIIAIFLIPATQLIVSYVIDVGNSAAYQVKQWVDFKTILSYAHEQQYGPQRDVTYNCLIEKLNSSVTVSQTSDALGGDANASPDGFDIGKAYSGPEKKAVEEKIPQLSKQLQMMYNFFNCAASYGLVILAEFQLVMMSYLFLLGPLAGAFYAWPELGKNLFNKVFSNWVEAVITLSLWRFWWLVVLACLTTYIQYERDQGFFDPSSEWELMMFTSFQVLLLVVPFCPFNFQAAAKASIEKIEDQAKQKAEGGGGSGGGGGGGGGGASGGGAGAGGQSHSGGGERHGMRHHITSPAHSGGGSSGPSAPPDASSPSSASGGESSSSSSSSSPSSAPPAGPSPGSDPGSGRSSPPPPMGPPPSSH